MLRKKGTIFMQEIMIVLAIMSILIFITSASYKYYRKITESKQKLEKMQIIQNALHEFVKVYGRLPVPAPYVKNTDNAYGNEGNPSNCTNFNIHGKQAPIYCRNLVSYMGLIPYKTLNINDPEKFREKNGLEITYVVSPAITYNNSLQYLAGNRNQFKIKQLENGRTIIDTNIMGGIAYFLISVTQEPQTMFNSNDGKFRDAHNQLSTRIISLSGNLLSINYQSKGAIYRNTDFIQMFYYSIFHPIDHYIFNRHPDNYKFQSTIVWDSTAFLHSLYIRNNQ